MLENVVFIGGYRTYIGKENGIYRHIPAEKLGAHILEKMAGQYELPQLVIAGNAIGAGGNIARLMTLEAGFPDEIPAITVDSQCSSGLEAILLAVAKIQSGQQEIIMAGGMESCSTAPKRALVENHPEYQGETWYKTAKFAPGNRQEDAMLLGAERTAKVAGINRQQLHKWVLRSHHFAATARKQGLLEEIIAPIGVKNERDQGIRESMTEAFLDKISPIYGEEGVTTAGNACGTQDGAAFVLLCSEHFAKEHNYLPQMQYVDMAEVAGNPEMSPSLVNPAIDALLKKIGKHPEEIDMYECNEAFAVIDELFAEKYPGCVPAYNAWGGALAYGHPYGATGGILTLHLAQRMKQMSQNDGYGMTAIAAAGGMGAAILWKKWGGWT